VQVRHLRPSVLTLEDVFAHAWGKNDRFRVQGSRFSVLAPRTENERGTPNAAR